MSTIIEVKDLNLWYGAHQALHHVSVEMPAHEITALIGPSGCGKSTLHAQPHERPGARHPHRGRGPAMDGDERLLTPASTPPGCASRSAWCSKSPIPSP